MTRNKKSMMETLEVRRLLSTVVVNMLLDESIPNSTTSLREAIAVAGSGTRSPFKLRLRERSS